MPAPRNFHLCQHKMLDEKMYFLAVPQDILVFNIVEKRFVNLVSQELITSSAQERRFILSEGVILRSYALITAGVP